MTDMLVTDMSYLFENMEAFDASNVTDMRSVFDGASSFNQPIILDMSQVTDMNFMFCVCVVIESTDHDGHVEGD